MCNDTHRQLKLHCDNFDESELSSTDATTNRLQTC